MAAIEFLIEKYYANEGIMKIEWLEQAKKIEEEQTGYTEGDMQDCEYHQDRSPRPPPYHHDATQL